MPDASTSSLFVMHGARAAIEGGMTHIKEQVEGIERAVDGNPGLTFDLAKTLIESVCKTILRERSITFDPGDDLPRLFRTTRINLPFLPSSASNESEVRRSLEQTLNGLHTAVQGICELRNACGFASHGSDSPRPMLENVQALLVAETADAIVGFLYRIHRQDYLPPPSSRAEYEKNQDFNDYVDNAHRVIQIFEAQFKPSEVLFQMEPETYRVYLAEFLLEPDVESGNESGTPEVAP